MSYRCEACRDRGYLNAAFKRRVDVPYLNSRGRPIRSDADIYGYDFCRQCTKGRTKLALFYAEGSANNGHVGVLAVPEVTGPRVAAAARGVVSDASAPRCAGITADGRRCSSKPRRWNRYCAKHGWSKDRF